MIITTTNSVEGRQIDSYVGVVFNEIISGVNFIKDFGAMIRNFVGRRSAGYEEELMKERASQMGCDAIVGVKIDYETLGADGGMLMVTCSGTGIKLR